MLHAKCRMRSAAWAMPCPLPHRLTVALPRTAHLPQPSNNKNAGAEPGAAAVGFFTARGFDKERIEQLPNDAVVSRAGFEKVM